MTKRRWTAAAAATMTTLASVAFCAHPREARAFCGFYVSGADAQLTNNATQVVLMRDGTRTVLSMQNNYQGPPQDFAMVVPVPVVLQKENVKTLPRDVFDRVDQLTAPRLVEYWEQDPCPAADARRRGRRVRGAGIGGRGRQPRPARWLAAQGGARSRRSSASASTTSSSSARPTRRALDTLAPTERLQDPRRRRAVPAPVRRRWG